MSETIFEHKVKLEMSQDEAEQLIQTFSDYLENCQDISTMKCYVSFLEDLEKQLDEQELK